MGCAGVLGDRGHICIYSNRGGGRPGSAVERLGSVVTLFFET